MLKDYKRTELQDADLVLVGNRNENCVADRVIDFKKSDHK